MSTMYTYSLYAFLLMRETGDRLISGLVDNGFSVTPCLTGDKAYYTGDVSTLTCLMLKHSEKDSNKIYNMIFNIIKDKEIPCFGYVLLHGNGGAKFFGGFMPMQKKASALQMRGR